jgi:hypothetical protein
MSYTPRHLDEKWSQDGIYYLLKFASKHDWGREEVVAEDEYVPNETDANLVWSAPDLYEALPDPVRLRYLAQWFDDQGKLVPGWTGNIPNDLRSWADRIEAAKAKAEGK